MRLRTVLGLLLLAPVPGGASAQPLTAVPFHEVEITGGLWKRTITVHRTATLEACLKQCEKTGRIRNFLVAGGLVPGEHRGPCYNDSDVYKVLEGIAYTLKTVRDPTLEKRADRIIDAIAAAQQDDGYLNTYVTLVKPAARWRDIRSGHELYCAGHLIEAAVAYFQATGKRKLLDVAVRFADLIHRTFGPGHRMDPPGHQEIELALVKLHRLTGEKKYLELARFFLDRRGRPAGRSGLFGEYCQDARPVREQSEVVGHAVRAMYQYTAMADVAAETGERSLRHVLERLGRDVVGRKMYLTGGIGDSASNEGFTGPYVLPNESAYAETCAAIGMALWNHRMFLLTGEGRYLDVVEREILNGILAGVSLGGNRFFYRNRLASRGGVERVPWFTTSCCPTNIARFVPALGERIYAHRDNEVYVGLHVASRAAIGLKDGKVRLVQFTDYPRTSAVRIEVSPEKPFPFTLKLRRPGWCEGTARLRVNGRGVEAPVVDGFFVVGRTWKAGDVVELEMAMPVRRVHADPRVQADAGRVALMRGPVVYCLEGVDHGGHVWNIFLPEDAALTARFDPKLLGGTMVIEGEAKAVERVHGRRAAKPARIRAVPYRLWANRGPGEMVVWIPESAELAEAPGEGPRLLSAGVVLKASHCYENDTLAALNDGRLPETSGDHSIPRMTWWPRRGSAEWVEVAFPRPRRLRACSVYWFDDTGVGRCRVPESWRLLYRHGHRWKPVELTGAGRYGTSPDAFNAVRFRPVETPAVRLEVVLKQGFSAGILEWRVK